MPLALCAMSHSPLIGQVILDEAEDAEVWRAVRTARQFVRDFDPELVAIFAPDHFNGFYYDVMPAYCIGAAAAGVGDWGTTAAALTVPVDEAVRLAEHALECDVDVALSYRMRVDHGMIQPLEALFDDPWAQPVLPIFVNCAAPPLGRPARAGSLGRAVGRYLAERGGRVLVLASGGLSHDPPVPDIRTAPPDVVEQLTAGTPTAPEERPARERRVRDAAEQFSRGEGPLRPLNPQWDNDFLDILESRSLERLEPWSSAWCQEQAGRGGHEVRTWIAAYSALSAQGDYRMSFRFYAPVEPWIAGFAVTLAVSRTR